MQNLILGKMGLVRPKKINFSNSWINLISLKINFKEDLIKHKFVQIIRLLIKFMGRKLR